MPVRSQIAAAVYVGLAVLMLATSRTVQLIAGGVLLLAGGWVLWTTQQALVAMRQQNRAAEEANQRLRAAIAQAEELAIEQERIRVAREIHDGLGHHLNNVKVYVGVAHRAFEVDPTVAQASLTTAKTEIGNAQGELRRAIDALAPHKVRRGCSTGCDCVLQDNAGYRATSRSYFTPDCSVLHSRDGVRDVWVTREEYAMLIAGF